MAANELETYLSELNRIRRTGGYTDESSFYTPLANLFNALGAGLKPRVNCVMQLREQGAGHPDGGLYTPDQFPRQSGMPEAGQKPSRGAIEAKPTSDDAVATAGGEQVDRYWRQYHQVLVTNFRDFVLVGRDREGNKKQLETFPLAANEEEFWELAAHPRKAGQQLGARFAEFLKRVMLTRARLTEPKELASLLAAYAREALLRVEDHAGLPALANLRKALEDALGLKFEGKRGEHFFRSTFVQTLFYGVFSAWVLWSKQHDFMNSARFSWREAQWKLHVPMIRVLFEQIATRTRLEPLDLIEVLDWAEDGLNRVDRADFFGKFEEQHAVQYFYEPFLEAFDPTLRKELGVWYTPLEIVRYMVARCDQVLRSELNVEDGFADPSVYVLDPGCGTGAYLVEVLKTIQKTYEAKGEGALASQQVKKAALERVFGFEILPAPFVISHMQLGLLLQNLGAPLKDDTERAAVYLTNSLTGWEPPREPKTSLLFPEMEQERERAANVKRHAPILVVLGNPPYNGFAGVAVEEERALSDAYRTTRRAPAPEGQGLNDLYVRFYRMAERRIVEQTGQGVVCFISNYSWLDGLSFTGMRERYLEAFNSIWIDNLHGDRIMSERAPTGETSETVFAIAGKSPGIRVGTAIALLARSRKSEASVIRYRDRQEARASDRRVALLTSLSEDPLDARYSRLDPVQRLGFPFKPLSLGAAYLSWPRVPELFASTSPGVNTSRDEELVSIGKDELTAKIELYFDAKATRERLKSTVPGLLVASVRFDPEETRRVLIRLGISSGYFVRYAYRPFDTRWVYWHPETELLDRRREDLFSAAQSGARFLISRQKAERQREGTPFYLATRLPDRHLTRPGSACFPVSDGARTAQQARIFHAAHDFLADAACTYLGEVGAPLTSRLLAHHALAVGYSGDYLQGNEDAIRQDWPRVPLPATVQLLSASADLGAQVAALLDTEAPVKGITSSAVRPELKAVGVLSPSRLNPAEDLKITAGWGHAGKGGVTMPGKGKAVERDYETHEREAIAAGAQALGLSFEEALAQLGETTFDIYLNDRAYWKNVPSRVWDYTIGGYQVVKKWLSYRECKLLGRAITGDEAREVMNMARRIAALCLLRPALDANYAAVKANTYPWPPVARARA